MGLERNINLLTALVAIGEGIQNLDENHGIIRLTLLATVFLPFTTVGAILSMQGNYAPGGSKFWVFWVVAATVMLLMLAFSPLSERIRWLLSKNRTILLRFKATAKLPK